MTRNGLCGAEWSPRVCFKSVVHPHVCSKDGSWSDSEGWNGAQRHQKEHHFGFALDLSNCQTRQHGCLTAN